MMKGTYRWYFILGIMVAVFSVVAFLLPFYKNVSFIIGYVSGVLAMVLQIYFYKSAFAGIKANSQVYGFSVMIFGIMYLIIQLVVSIVEMAFSLVIPFRLALLINILVIAVAFIGFAATKSAQEYNIKHDAKLQSNVRNMGNLQHKASSLISQCCDGEMKKNIQKLAQNLRYSDPVTCEESVVLEVEMETMLCKIQGAVDDGNASTVSSLCEKMEIMLEERNRICIKNK